ncbi:MAG: Spy/CpxP family protein refolding chaperone [Polyangiaceae bacterium]
MHPGMFGWWHARRHACGEGLGCAPHGGHHGEHEGRSWGRHGGPFGGDGGGGDDIGGGSFGVRRPLRFLAFKLELDEGQVTELAAILSDLKTERAQAAVDQRRTTSALAESIAGESFDESKARAAADDRVKSSGRVQDAVVRALGRIHASLKPEQRAKLAYLLRTGALSM